MKKIFSFLVACLATTMMMAQTNLFDAATATIESWSNPGWTSGDITNFATWADGTATVPVPGACNAQWQCQVKLHTTGLTLDASKNYEFKCTINSNAAFGGVTLKLFNSAPLSDKSDYALVAGNNNITTAAFTGGSVGDGIIVFDFGYAPANTVLTISNIILQESSAPVILDPKPTTAPAAPTADAATVLSVYSNTYPAAAPFGYCEGWGQSTTLEELNFDGNTVLYYKKFNWLGWGCQGTPIDATTCTGLHLDIWAAAAGSIKVTPIYGGEGLVTDDTHGKVVALVEGWNSVDLNLATDFPGLNFESIFQFKFDNNVGGEIFAFDNVYFTGYTAPTVVYSSLADVRKCAKDSVVTLKDFEVVYAPAADNRYYYIKDATSTCVIYAPNYGLVAGDKVAKGLVGTVDIYNGLYEIKPTTAKSELTITPGTAPEPANATAAPTAADQSKYMIYKKVKVAANAAFSSSTKNTVMGIFGKDTIAFYNNFKIAATLEAGKEYDIVGVNSVYNDPQVIPVSVAEHQGMVDECAGEHGLYDAATAAITDTYFAVGGWGPNPGCTADMENGTIVIHVDKPFGDMWNGQVFVNPGFSFTPGKAYHYEFDIVSSAKVCITVKVNDSDDYPFFSKPVYDINMAGGTYHFSTDSVFANDSLNTAKGPLVFGFGWTEGNQDVIIKCIKITEIGDAPKPVEERKFIKHAWGTGAEADKTWQEMTKREYMNSPAWTYTGAWGGEGINIADSVNQAEPKWFATSAIRILDSEGIIAEEPAIGTAGCEFIYVPSLDNGGIIPATYLLLPAETAVENLNADAAAVKFIQDGRLMIRRGEHIFDAQGRMIR